jgi:hypothetical protein
VVSLTGTVAQVVKIARNTIPDQRAKRSESRGSRRTYDFDGEHTESNQRLIDPGVGFPTEVASSRCVGRCGVHFEHGKFCVAAPDHEPVTRAAGDLSTDFASELLKRAHNLVHFHLPHCHGALLQESFENKTPRFNRA